MVFIYFYDLYIVETSFCNSLKVFFFFSDMTVYVSSMDI